MKYFLLSALFLACGIAKAQEAKFETITFCGKTLEDETSRSSITVQELRNCNLWVMPDDTSLKVQSFILTIVPLNNPVDLKEVPVQGNKIPNKYLEAICSAKLFRMEKVTLVAPDESYRQVLPIIISVQP